jgi:hypothetical protein
MLAYGLSEAAKSCAHATAENSSVTAINNSPADFMIKNITPVEMNTNRK